MTPIIECSWVHPETTRTITGVELQLAKKPLNPATLPRFTTLVTYPPAKMDASLSNPSPGTHIYGAIWHYDTADGGLPASERIVVELVVPEPGEGPSEPPATTDPLPAPAGTFAAVYREI